MWLQVQQHCSTVDPEQRPKHARALMRSLADWAEDHRALNEVIQLPLSTLEEEASLMIVHVCLLVPMTRSSATPLAMLCRLSECLSACLQGGGHLSPMITQ